MFNLIVKHATFHQAEEDERRRRRLKDMNIAAASVCGEIYS